MNILIVESSILPTRGGIQRVSYRLSEYFESVGIGCFFLYYLVGFDEFPESKLLKYDNKESYGTFRLKVLSFIREKGIDLVLIQGLTSNLIVNFLKENSKRNWVKTIFCLHLTPDYFIYENKQKTLKQRLKEFILGYDSNALNMRKIYKNVDAYVLLSNRFKSKFLELTGIKDASHLFSISNPLSFDVFQQDNVKNKDVLIVTRFHESQKNLSASYRIWKRVEEYAVKNGWTLKLAGYGNDQDSSLGYAMSLELKNFQFLGKTENPSELFKNAAIFMMTSCYEGFPMTLLEVQQYGCVPIVFDSFASVHDIISADNGILVQAFNEEKYASELIQLMMRSDLRDKLSKNGIETCKRFSLNNIGNEWIALFKNIGIKNV